MMSVMWQTTMIWEEEIGTRGDRVERCEIVEGEGTSGGMKGGEFVTVVKVEDPKYVTVVNVGPQEEEVLVYRLPGERLGFGLKFEGGVHSSERVSGVTIQSCAEDSPASRAAASWGPLAPGDSVLAVDGVPVSQMTRTDCVRALKESNVVVRLGVRRGGPPPVPPRRLPRKRPPPAQVYTDLLAGEEGGGESESDDTGSTVSTVVPSADSSFSEGFPESRPPPRPAPRAPRPLPPRLIHFLPKDHRTDLLAPSPRHTPPHYSKQEPCPAAEIQTGNKENSKEENGEENLVPIIPAVQPPSAPLKNDDKTKLNDIEESKPPKFKSHSNLIKKRPQDFLFEMSKTVDSVDNNVTLGKNDNFSIRIWGDDEKSCKSVKDKIALFSKSSNCLSDPSVKTLSKPTKMDFLRENESYDRSDNDESFHGTPSKIFDCDVKKSFYSCNNLFDIAQSSNNDKKLSNSSRTQSHTDLLSSNNHSINAPYSKFSSSSVTSQNASFDLSKNNSTKRGSLHTRSLSLVDVGSKSCCPPYKSLDDARRSSLNSIIAQRKKTMSKLRGLVIPEKVAEVQTTSQIIDLPEIKTKTTLLTSSVIKECDESVSKVNVKPNVLYTHKNCQMPSPPWKTENENIEIPKYSPAFKRKSLSLYGSSSLVSSVSSSLSSSREELRSCFGDPSKPLAFNSQNPSRTQNHLPNNNNNNHIEPKSLESITSPSVSDSSFEYVPTNDAPSLKLVAENLNKINQYSIKPNNRKVGDESDNDSAVSSSRSSITHGLSPPHSPILESEKSHANIDEIELNDSINYKTSPSLLEEVATDSSDECSALQNDTHRILKSQSVEAINRKNVLTSAKHRNGLAVKTIVPENCTFNTNLLESDTNKIRSSEIEIKNALNLEIPTIDSKVEINDLSAEELINQSDQVEKHNAVVSGEPENLNNLINGTKESYQLTELSGTIEETEADRKLVDFPFNKVNGFTHNDNTNDVSFDKEISPKYCSMNGNIPKKEQVFDDPPCDIIVDSPLNSFNRNDNSKLKINENSNRSRNSSALPGLENGNEIDLKTSKFNLLKSSSVNDIKRVFEKSDAADLVHPKSFITANSVCHPRVSSIDSPSDDNFVAASRYNSASDLQKESQFGSITSLASSTSLISQQELSQLIEESNQVLQEDGGSQEVLVVVLHRETVGGSVGITLAGGTDYESKEITVHKVLSGSPADRDGRIKKGDRILSINGKSMKGLTHRESLAILKAPRPEVVLVISRYRSEILEENGIPCVKTVTSQRQPRIPEHTSPQLQRGFTVKWGPVVSVTLVKDGSGLGFSLEGGKDSPFGDQPLTIKKIFTGGCAEKSGQLFAGDELLTVNNTDLSGLSRIEAWALMKKLPDGKVLLKIRHPST